MMFFLPNIQLHTFTDLIKNMRKISIAFFLISFMLVARAQKDNSGVDRPKLVVGIMVDQMRWDFLYRYASRYGNDGFKRMLGEGFTCENTFIPYAQTVTACGHATVYTGSLPSIHGIMGNEWYDKQKGRSVYCVEDDGVTAVGSTKSLPMSPKNMTVTSMCDELRIATNFKAKVIGIAIKDRGGILPAGHSANGAYWYESSTGNWISSSYYMKELPAWVNAFNQRRLSDSLYRLNWNTMYPVSSYVMSDPDDKPYEGAMSGEQKPVFPHNTSRFAGVNYGILPSTPHGNTLTLQFAKQAMLAERLGADDVTDFLAISLSSPDYIGHQYGPNSIEVEDTYLRLDKELGEFFRFLDSRLGKSYTVFLTADHGVAHAPGYAMANNLPGGVMLTTASAAVKKTISQFGLMNVIDNYSNYQIYLNKKAIDSAKLNFREVKTYFIEQLNKEEGIHYAFDNELIMNAHLPSEVKERFIKGLHPKLGGDIQVILKSGYYPYSNPGATHGSWYPYDSHIPFVLMGWGIKQGRLLRDVNMTDIAPTISSLLRIQMPSGNVGNTVSEALK
jgi:predicted AlkP superfamily pyrophosphatase or phosphodiesterase